MASMRHSRHSITTYNPTLVSAYLSWTKGENITHLPPRGTLREPPNNQQYVQIKFFIVVKCMVSLKHSWPSITTSNPIPVTAYLS